MKKQTTKNVVYTKSVSSLLVLLYTNILLSACLVFFDNLSKKVWYLKIALNFNSKRLLYIIGVILHV